MRESKARKLRLEAAAVARAASKIVKCASAIEARREELEAKRQASSERRATLLAGVRLARAEACVTRANRLAALAELESKASATRAKKIEATVTKSAAQVKHATFVAEKLKQQKKEALDAAAARLEARMAAASFRREWILAGTVEGAASVCGAAEKTRLRHLYDQKAAIEERRLRLRRTMDAAEARRAATIEDLQTKLRGENTRIAEAVTDTKLRIAAKPDALRRASIRRQQMAQVTRLEHMHKSTGGARLSASGAQIAEIAEIGSSHVEIAGHAAASGREIFAPSRARDATSPAPKTYIRWMGPNGGAGRERTPPSTPSATPSTTPSTTPEASPMDTIAPAAPWSAKLLAAKPKAAVVIIVPTDRKPTLPPRGLLERLLFMPRMLAATASARHATAGARRASRLCLIKQIAALYSTVRVARAAGRRAVIGEIRRSVLATREAAAAARASARIGEIAARAAKCSERATQAKYRRSAARLSMLNACIAAEESRQLASLKREKRILTLRRGRVAESSAAAVRARRAAQDESAKAKGEAREQRCAAVVRRHADILAMVSAKARLSCLRRQTPAKLVAKAPSSSSADVVIFTGFEPSAAAVDEAASVQASLVAVAEARAATVTVAAATSDAAAAKALTRAAEKAAEKAAAASVEVAAADAGLLRGGAVAKKKKTTTSASVPTEANAAAASAAPATEAADGEAASDLASVAVSCSSSFRSVVSDEWLVTE